MNFTLDEAINYQTELEILRNKLNNDYNPRKPKNQKRKITFQNLQENCWMQEKVLLVFLKNELFRIKVIYLKQKKKNEKKNQKKEESKNLSNILRINQRTNYDLFKDYFKFVVPSALVKKLYEIKNKKKKKKLVNVTKSGLSDLKDRIKEMSDDEKKLNNQPKY